VTTAPTATRPRGLRIGSIVLAISGLGLYVLAVFGAAVFALPALDTHRGGDGYAHDFASALRVLGALFSLGVLPLGAVGAVLGFAGRARVAGIVNALLCVAAIIIIATSFRI